MLRINICYETIGPNDFCEPSDRGFVEEGKEIGFRELVQLFRRCESLSSSHVPYSDVAAGRVWGEMPADVDYSTGAEYRETIHYSGGGEKYWRKALRAAKWIK